jgi:hypothetical protein
MANNNNSNKVPLGQEKDSKLEFKIQENDFKNLISSPMPQPEERKENKFKDKNFYKSKEHMMDFAMLLNSEASKLGSEVTREQRWNKFAGKYQVLYENSPGLFQAALMGQLMEGEVGKVVKAFISASGNPEKIMKGFESYLDEKIEPIKQVALEIQKSKGQQ